MDTPSLTQLRSRILRMGEVLSIWLILSALMGVAGVTAFAWMDKVLWGFDFIPPWQHPSLLGALVCAAASSAVVLGLAYWCMSRSMADPSHRGATT